MRQNTFDLQLNFSLYKTYTRYLLLTKLSLLLLTKLTLPDCPYQIVLTKLLLTKLSLVILVSDNLVSKQFLPLPNCHLPNCRLPKCRLPKCYLPNLPYQKSARPIYVLYLITYIRKRKFTMKKVHMSLFSILI